MGYSYNRSENSDKYKDANGYEKRTLLITIVSLCLSSLSNIRKTIDSNMRLINNYGPIQLISILQLQHVSLTMCIC